MLLYFSLRSLWSIARIDGACSAFGVRNIAQTLARGKAAPPLAATAETPPPICSCNHRQLANERHIQMNLSVVRSSE